MNFIAHCVVPSLIAALAVSSAVNADQNQNFTENQAKQEQPSLTLQQAITLAQQHDPWLHGSQLKQSATLHRSVAVNTLPNPNVAISIMNLPTDSWEFNQEGMTQFKVGVSQMFPRGDTVALQQQQLEIASSKFALLRSDRKAKLKAMISGLWLDAYRAQQTIHLIESDWDLFEQMADVARASYSSALGQTRQQDVIRAQLEIVQLHDRLTVQKQIAESANASLSQWLPMFEGQHGQSDDILNTRPVGFELSTSLPTISLADPSLLDASAYDRSALAKRLNEHPAVKAVEVQRSVSKKAVDIAKQGNKPQWGVSASYGYRGQMASGVDNADLFSFGVSVDIPLFNQVQQDALVSASIAESEAIGTEKLVLIKQMMSEVEKGLKQLYRLSQRQSLYSEQLLTQTYQQAEVALTAYTNDDGDFSEVVRARMAELDARIAALNIEVDILKVMSQLNYYFADAASIALAPTDRQQSHQSHQSQNIHQRKTIARHKNRTINTTVANTKGAQ